MRSARTYFPSVDILRGFAAISVVVYHVIEHFSWKSFPVSGPWVWFRIGWMGVDLFFVISGFVIGLSAFAEIDRNGFAGFRGPFIRRRLARIVPLHYLTCLVFVVFIVPELIFQPNAPINFIAHALFLHNLAPGLHGAINGSNWSLGTEMQFYLLILLIAPWLFRGKWLGIVLTLVGIAWVWRYAATVLITVSEGSGPFALFVASTQLPGMLDEFAVGLLLARFVRSETGLRLLKAGEAHPWALVCIVAGLIWAVLALFWDIAGSYWKTPWVVMSFRTFLAVAFGGLVFVACCLKGSSWLRLTAPLRYAGDVSYGIYLWHLPVIMALKRLDWLTPDRALPVVLCVTLLFASWSWHFFEKPLIARFGKAHSPKRHESEIH